MTKSTNLGLHFFLRIHDLLALVVVSHGSFELLDDEVAELGRLLLPEGAAIAAEGSLAAFAVGLSVQDY